jgi:hypothetical protein
MMVELFLLGLGLVLYGALKIPNSLTQTLAQFRKPARPKDEQGNGENHQNFRKAKSKRHNLLRTRSSTQSGHDSLLPIAVGALENGSGLILGS